MSAASLRARYLGDAVATSSPQQVLVMLYDRLALDLERAQKAVAAGDREAAQRAAAARPGRSSSSCSSSLQVDAWEGGPRLAALYNWLISELVQANVKLDTNRDLVLPPGRRAAARRVAAGRGLAGRQSVMTEPAVPGDAARGTTGRRGGELGRRCSTHLEGEVLAAEETLARGRAEEIAAWGRRADDWIPPSNLGPLPHDLRERAARLLQHQLAVAEALVERITQSPEAARRRRPDVLRHRPARSPPSSTGRSEPRAPVHRRAPAPRPPRHRPADGRGVRAFSTTDRARRRGCTDAANSAAPVDAGHSQVTAGHIRPATPHARASLLWACGQARPPGCR